MARPNQFNLNKINGLGIEKRPNHPYFSRHVLKDSNIKCSNCGALMWIEEKTEGSKKKSIIFIMLL